MILNSQGTPYLKSEHSSFLNPSHPATSRAIVGFLNFNRSVTGRYPNATITDIGAGNYFNGTTSKTLFPKGGLGNQGPLTIMAVFTPLSLSAIGCISALYSSGSYSPSEFTYRFWMNTDGSLAFYRAKTNGTMNKFTTDTGLAAVGKKVVAVVTHEGTSTDANARWAVNGKLKEGVGAWDGNYGGGNNWHANCSIGCNFTESYPSAEAYGDFFQGYIETIVFWPWYMPGNLMRQLSLNPYELFMPRVGRIFKASGGVSVTVNPTVLSLALGIQAPVISTTESVTVSPSALSLAANLQAPVVTATQNVTVSPSVLSLALNLQTPVVTATESVTVSPSALSLAINLQAPVISAAGDIVVSPSAISLVAGLQAPAISGDCNLTAALLSVIANLQAPTETGTCNVSAAALSLAANLVAPNVIIGSMVAPEFDLKSKQERTVTLTSEQSRTEDLKSKQSRSITGDSAI